MAASTEPIAGPLTHPALRRQISSVPYLPGLDGMRALAVIAVMVYHANHTWLRGGFLGVEVFFVISGYLITLLIIGEKERTGRVSLRHFWLRRARRLLPALFTMLGALGIYMALFDRRPMGATRGDFVGGIFYGSNWYQIWVGQGYTDFEAMAPLRHLWSLAVEEQFYLIWPLVMLLLVRRGPQRLPRVGLGLFATSVAIALVTGFMFVSGDVAMSCVESTHGYLEVFGRCINVNESLYLGTFSRAGGLMMGAAFAMVWRPLAVMRGPMRRRGHRLDLAALAALAGLVLLVLNVYISTEGELLGVSYDPWLFRGGFFVTGLCTVLLIAAATHRRSWIGRLLGMRPLHWVGTRSYGLYLYHWPVYQIIREPGLQLGGTEFLIAMLITVPITELSYRLIETPVRLGRLGEWLRGARPPRTLRAARRRRRGVMIGASIAVLTGFAAVSIATAQLLCVGEVECSLVQADSASPTIGSIPSTTTAPTAPTTTVADDAMVPGSTLVGATTTTTSAPTTTTVDPLDLLPVWAIGESVMLGAKPQLEAGGVWVNAEVSRQGKGVAEILEWMRAQGQIGRTIVIQTGTNGSVSDETFARIMTQLPADQTPLVVFLTVKAPRGWIADNNTRIRNLPMFYPNVLVADWEVESAQVAGELSRSDGGIHLATAHAKQFYANLVFNAIGRPDLVR